MHTIWKKYTNMYRTFNCIGHKKKIEISETQKQRPAFASSKLQWMVLLTNLCRVCDIQTEAEHLLRADSKSINLLAAMKCFHCS